MNEPKEIMQHLLGDPIMFRHYQRQLVDRIYENSSGFVKYNINEACLDAGT